ncbi:MAG: UDP-3-O-(3-hydroxymyristoyl)glucosamine N-acyltransferase [Verrucomicrobiota bacterium]|nr:UDP-3-O-(3-hydroxymyristoyl)glucosamine N-acyltransferase [Verrucomicrobiota bacterium]
MTYSYPLNRILEIIGANAVCEGDFSGSITGIASLSSASAGDLSFLGNPQYKDQVEHSNASILLLPRDHSGKPKANQLFLKVDNPSYALALLCRNIEIDLLPKPLAGIHPTAIVDPSAKVHNTASVGAFCCIGPQAVIGPDVTLAEHISIGRAARVEEQTQIFPRVVVGDYCEIGSRNRLLQGCVIGSDGYGYTKVHGVHQRLPQIGTVVTGADVDVGANTTVDRARFGRTEIGDGTKIDNLVQIGHNVSIGRHCLLVAQVGVGGSTKLGNGVVVAGQAGIAGHLNIGDGVIITAAAVVVRSIEANLKVGGCPAQASLLTNRIYSLQRKLPDLFKRFDQLEKTIESYTQL